MLKSALKYAAPSKTSFSAPPFRSIYKKSAKPAALWVKSDVDVVVHKTLFEYANVPDEMVSA
jgi:hypothetical protein